MSFDVVSQIGATTLGDLGERRLIDEVLKLRYGTHPDDHFGDDCAILSLADWGPSQKVVVTTDPCPEPAIAWAGVTDLYYRGWLLATINLSDLAAAGAQPIGVVTSLELPNETTLGDFERLLDGLDECCALHEAAVVGGNVKEATRLSLTATALGRCAGDPMGRTGAVPGDVVCVVGDLGTFWAAIALERGWCSVHPDDQEDLRPFMLMPTPKIAAGQALRASGRVAACMDNSDGLYGCAAVLARSNGAGVRLDFSRVSFRPSVARVADELGVAPERLALGWGDWQLVVCVRPTDLAAVEEVVSGVDLPLHRVGHIIEEPGVFLSDGQATKPMQPIDSERFTKDSWFLSGLDGYVETLLRGPLSQA